MEQSVELRIRRVTYDRYDIVLLRDGEVMVKHGVTFVHALDWLRVWLSSLILELKAGDSINFKSQMKFM